MAANAFLKTKIGLPPTYSLRIFFLKMGLRKIASRAGFPKMEVNFHKYFRGFHSRMSWIWVKNLFKPYQTLPASSVHYTAGCYPGLRDSLRPTVGLTEPFYGYFLYIIYGDCRGYR